MSYNDIPAGKDLPNDINVVIEIPANHDPIKYEVDKDSDAIFVDRFVATPMFYPANYGYVPQTLSEDGDPLDVIMLGSSVPRATVIAVKPIAVLRLLDDGEQDDKILAVPLEGPMSDVNSLAELNQRYSGVTQIIELWFTRYKGPGRMESQGYANSDAAWEMINISSSAFEAKHSN